MNIPAHHVPPMLADAVLVISAENRFWNEMTGLQRRLEKSEQMIVFSKAWISNPLNASRQIPHLSLSNE